MSHYGWYNVAFERDLTETITPAVIGTTRLILVRTETGVQAYSADCPHRGMHLGYGGSLRGDAVVCPFHGYRITLGEHTSPGFCIPAYPTLVWGGLVLVQLDAGYDYGLTAFLDALVLTHTIVPGFELPIATAAPMIIENAFDNRHFAAVHHIRAAPFHVSRGSDGHLVLQSMFSFPRTAWIKGANTDRFLEVSFTGRTFSPGIIISELGGETPYIVMTMATPQPDGTCIIRFSIALERARYGETPDRQFCTYLFAESKKGLLDDKVMWEQMRADIVPQFTPHDYSVQAFQQFCAEFMPVERKRALPA